MNTLIVVDLTKKMKFSISIWNVSRDKIVSTGVVYNEHAGDIIDLLKWWGWLSNGEIYARKRTYDYFYKHRVYLNRLVDIGGLKKRCKIWEPSFLLMSGFIANSGTSIKMKCHVGDWEKICK